MMLWNKYYFLFRQYAAVILVNLNLATAGMNVAWSSPMLVKLRNVDETPLRRPITEEEGSWIVAGGYLLAIFSTIPVAMLLDLIGRKYCILLVSIPKLLMTLLLPFATEVWMIIFSRILTMAVDTFLLSIIPVYASEIASKEHRGILGTFMQIFCTMGILFTLSVGPFLSYIVFSIVFCCAVLLTSIPIVFLPDSPFYLYSKGRIEEALEVLKMLRSNEEIAKQELEEYEQSITKTEEKVDIIALLKDKFFIKSLFFSAIIAVGAQATGFNAVQFYLQTILESTHVDIRPKIGSVIVGVIQFICSLCSAFVIALFRRRTVLLSSVFGIFLGMLGLGTFFNISESDGYEISGFMNYLPIISIILVISCYSIGIGAMLVVVVTEFFDGPARAIGVFCTCASSLIIIFFLSKYFALMISALGPTYVYWSFGGMCVIFGTLIAIFIPETKGKSFREIQKSLGRV